MVLELWAPIVAAAASAVAGSVAVDTGRWLAPPFSSLLSLLSGAQDVRERVTYTNLLSQPKHLGVTKYFEVYILLVKWIATQHILSALTLQARLPFLAGCPF